MSTEAVEIAIGINAHVVNGLLASAQSALLAQLKAAGNDLNALATKAGTSVAFLGEKRWDRCLTLYLANHIAV